jgi:hypothetical protein
MRCLFGFVSASRLAEGSADGYKYGIKDSDRNPERQRKLEDPAMKKRAYIPATALILVIGTAGAAYLRNLQTGADMTRTARAYLATLSDEQKAVSLMDFDTPQRVGWHFIPMDERKGLQIKHMNDAQRQAAFALLEAALSEAGYNKARTIMALEGILHELQKTRGGGPIRDPQRYYYTVFGEPSETGRWGLSIEGHHLSLNFVVDKNQVVASTPTFLAANPSVVKDEFPGMPEKGTRVLAQEERIAFALVQSLQPAQRAKAVIAERAPRDIRAAGEAEAPKYETTGLAYAEMNADQQKMVKRLIRVYAGNLPEDVCAQRLAAIDEAGYDRVHFAWAGADRPGIGHYYLIQGPTFQIEFVNVQPDSAGNPASHIHSVWRDPQGDFAIPIAGR